MVIYKRHIFILITIIGVFACNVSFAQNFSLWQLSGNTSRSFNIISGGSVDFRINSLNKYNEGVEYADWTKLEINIDDLGQDDIWELQFKANTQNIIGDGDNDLDLDYISLVARKEGGNGNQIEIPLEDDFVTLTEGDGEGDISKIVYITYRCGKYGDKKLLGEPFGYYVVDLVFRVLITEK